jgi:hypothetical protein
MRNRLWIELCQAKHNSRYCVVLLAYRRKTLNWFTCIILVFSSAGVMGWKFWNDLPLVSCVIISSIQLLRLIQPHLLPTEKQIDKLDAVVDFYFDYFNRLEALWFDYEKDRKTEDEIQDEFYKIKDLEKPINKIVNEIVKTTNKKILEKCDFEVREYLKIFN